MEEGNDSDRKDVEDDEERDWERSVMVLERAPVARSHKPGFSPSRPATFLE